jgi:acetyl-CoA C-acetyltransferase
MSGISDRVAIIGMGCTRFGEHWGQSADDLVLDASLEALRDAGVDAAAVEAYWFGTLNSGLSGLSLSRVLKSDYRPVTRVENLCATGTEAFRAACYAVAAGAADVAMAVGVEKLKDSGYAGLSAPAPPGDGTTLSLTDPAMFSLLVPAYCEKYGVDAETMREVLTRIAWKNHANGALNERAQFRKRVSPETISGAPLVAGSLRIFDCSGVADGAAAAIVVPAEKAADYVSDPLLVKAISVAASPGEGPLHQRYDFTTFVEATRSAADAYAQAGVTDPVAELALAEVHDCFTPTELILMEDLGFAQRGAAWKSVLDGDFDTDGRLPINPDGGLKSFGHPIGATGLRMLFECWLQLRQKAPQDRQLTTVGAGRTLGLTQNLGGWPGNAVSSVCIVGR